MLTRSEHLTQLAAVEQSLLEMRIVTDVRFARFVEVPESEIGLIKIDGHYRLSSASGKRKTKANGNRSRGTTTICCPRNYPRRNRSACVNASWNPR